MAKESKQPAAGDVDLSVVGTDALIQELASRHEAIIFAGVKLIEPQQFEMRVAGRTLLVAGLGQSLFMQTQRHLAKAMEGGNQ